MDLTYLIEQEDKNYFKDNIKFKKEGFENQNNYNLYSTNGLLFEPEESGEYMIEINKKELLIKVIDLPDNGIYIQDGWNDGEYLIFK